MLWVELVWQSEVMSSCHVHRPFYSLMIICFMSSLVLNWHTIYKKIIMPIDRSSFLQWIYMIFFPMMTPLQNIEKLQSSLFADVWSKRGLILPPNAASRLYFSPHRHDLCHDGNMRKIPLSYTHHQASNCQEVGGNDEVQNRHQHGPQVMRKSNSISIPKNIC